MENSGLSEKKAKFHITFNAPVVLCFSGICLIATILGQLSNGSISMLLFSTYRNSLASPLTYVRLFTHVFGHSGWDHFFGNISLLLLVGPLLEEKYGSKVIIELIGLTALATGLINNIFFPNIAILGASGVVFAFILISSLTGFKQGEIPLTFILVAIIYLGAQIYDGIFVQDNISNMAHIVGGIVGALSGFLLVNEK